MEPQKSDTTIQSNFTGVVVPMGFDPSAHIHLQDVLTDIASDAEHYTIQEVATNARDANIEAGSNKPVEIFLPTELRPEFRVKDSGPGMDQHEIETIYSLFGASTKRNTNTQTGSLGLGCKSPLSYTSQFNVISIKNGKRMMISVSKDEDGGASMTIIETVDTDEPNGTEVIIPAKRYNQFAQKAAKIFRFWGPGEVVVNGKEPKKMEGLQVSPTMLLVKREEYNETSYVVQGGVAYPVPRDYDPVSGDTSGYNRGSEYILVAEVNIGDVAFTPSREALKLNKQTKARLMKLKEEFLAAASKAVQDDLDKCKAAPEALKKVEEWKKALKLSSQQFLTLTWNGQPFPTTISCKGKLEKAVIASRNDRTLGSYATHEAVNLSWFANCLLIHDYTSTFTASHKKKLLGYCEQKGIAPMHFIMTDKPMDATWVEPDQVVDWKVIKEVTLESVAGYGRGAKAITGSYEAWTKDEYKKELAAKDIDQSEPVYWFSTEMFGPTSTSYYGRWSDKHVVDFLREQTKKGTIVKLGMNRIGKFQRDFPKSKSVKMALEELYKQKAKALGDDVVSAWELHESGVAETLKKLNASKVKDDDLKEAIRLSNLSIREKVKPLREFAHNKCARHLNTKNPFKGGCYDLSEHYPLLDEAGGGRYKIDQEDTYIYVNAKYKEVTNGESKATP